MVNKTIEKRTYTVEEIMEMLVIGKNTAYSLVKSGAFKSVKIGNRYRISKKSFDYWLDKSESDFDCQTYE